MTATPVSGGKEGLAAPPHPEKSAQNQPQSLPGKDSKPFQRLLENLKKPASAGNKKTPLTTPMTTKELKAALLALAGKSKPPASKLDLVKKMAEEKAKTKKKLIEALKALATSDGKTPVKKKLRARPQTNATPVVLLLATPPQQVFSKVKASTPVVEKKPSADLPELKHLLTKAQNAVSPLPTQIASANRQAPQNPALDKKTEAPSREKKLSVVDLRSSSHKTQGKMPLDAQPATSPGNLEVKQGVKAPEAKPEQSFQAVFQTVSGGTSSNFAAQAPAAPVPAQDLAALHRFLNGEGPGRMADQARFILKDNDRGEIHLTLYPETLGKVKIALNLNGQHLDGRIFVENQNVKDVFQQNLNGLLQAFRDSGWNDLALQVSVGGGDGSSGERSGSQDSAKGYHRSLKSESPETISVPGRIVGWSDRLVNLQA